MGCFVVGAVLTPPDIITQTLLSVPLYMLYEFGVFVSYFFEDPKNREETLRQMMAQREGRKAKRDNSPANIKKSRKKTA